MPGPALHSSVLGGVCGCLPITTHWPGLPFYSSFVLHPAWLESRHCCFSPPPIFLQIFSHLILFLVVFKTPLPTPNNNDRYERINMLYGLTEKSKDGRFRKKSILLLRSTFFASSPLLYKQNKEFCRDRFSLSSCLMVLRR